MILSFIVSSVFISAGKAEGTIKYNVFAILSTGLKTHMFSGYALSENIFDCFIFF